MNIDDRPTTDRRPTTDLRSPFTHFAKISNGHNSATRQLIPFVFLGWGFQGRRIERRHFRLDQIQDGGRRPFWKKLQMATRHPINVVFVFRFGFSARSDGTVRWNPTSRLRTFWKIQTTMSLKRIIRSDSLYVCSQTILCPLTLMTVDAHDRRLDTYFVRELGIKRKNEKADLEKLIRARSKLH